MKTPVMALLAGVLVIAGCDGSGKSNESATPAGEPPIDQPPAEDLPGPTENAAAISYNDMAVHDPSVIRDQDGTFYVFGSHLAAAKSTDLMTWKRVAEGANDTNPLFNTYASEVSEGIEWVGHQGSWAADVISLNDGRYYFYYNHCANPESEAGDCNLPRSYLGVAASDSIEGPYIDLGIFLRSGMTAGEITEGYGPEGVESYDPTIHPNTIDPDVFYDNSGKLWMTYGSYSGGIFILEMNEATAMPQPGQGYGKHLAGGNHSAIEGSYMLYSPESDYYYLFMSFGGYVSTDGYNIRVARSRNPDGPFLDAEGRDMVAARGGLSSITPYGVKLMGGFEFESAPGDPEPGRGYLSPGHNSAYYDADTGRHFLIAHTRFPNRGEQHAIRVHEMFINVDGWPVVSPHRYAPIDGNNVVDAGDLPGNYKFINHGKDINRTARESLYITLDEDGSITGEASGRYTLFADDPKRIDLELTVDGESKNYRGVMQWQWNNGAGELVPIFTALNSQGESIWGSRMTPRSTGEVLADIAADLKQPAIAKDSALDLPERGNLAAEIDWSSSDELVINSDGRVTRPNVGSGDASAILTAIISLNGETLSESFTVQVPQRLPYNRSAHFTFENDLADSLGRFGTGTATADRIWNSGNITYGTGQSGQALQLNGTNGVLLPQKLIDNYEYTVSFWANPTSISTSTTAFFGAVDEQLDSGSIPYSTRWISFLPQSWDDNTMVWSGSEQWFDGSAGERIPTGEWTHMAFAVKQGQVNVYLNGVQKFSGGTLNDFFTGATGKFALGVNYWNTPYNGLIDELKIYDSALSAEEIQFMDITPKPNSELLSSAVNLLDLGDLSTVREDLFLPTSSAYASAISWSSSNPSIISIHGETGRVTQPSVDTEVTLTAALTLNDEQQVKEFQATVKANAVP
ncbi:immunoglobulin-like domain-containing protein [Microbulbifer rhizosphaerae]|uniref:Arabinan endo-1,5-alpha-L-arabinosidase n=1 Tax=Microbulbifer rhizosphaerae TaxID=1562603 RepID=A0A7W4WAU1_9GAMM|nr:immunoglobulin-like domain-containing protein [Microbulbifer rhizosphaerae]MBB3060870.1 arabinan endo-1,5-alpha-L-arabinosidase [Microbulbifer rhizosphaerae]